MRHDGSIYLLVAMVVATVADVVRILRKRR
jgi:hypothetical protein